MRPTLPILALLLCPFALAAAAANPVLSLAGEWHFALDPAAETRLVGLTYMYFPSADHCTRHGPAQILRCAPSRTDTAEVPYWDKLPPAVAHSPSGETPPTSVVLVSRMRVSPLPSS